MSPSERAQLDQLAAGEPDESDLQTLQHMARLYDTVDPVPSGLVERIRFGITLDALHAEIAELERSGELAGVRAEEMTEARTVTFTSSTLTTMVTITPLSAERARIDGWVAPGGGVSVEARTGEGVTRTIADADGRFVFDDLARGLVQFTVRPPEGTPNSPVLTPPIEI
jgi:hypothetical protein